MEFAFYGECEFVEIFDSDKKFKKINLNKNIILSSNLSKKNKNKFKNLSEKKNIIKISNNKYLIDENILYKIVDIGKISNNDTVLEIGPGTGNLTEKIIKKNPKKFFVVEKDKKLAIFLKKKVWG